MEAKKHLRKPENWEDFENLCKKLWGEIWDCKEIKKNGRKGQTQDGVDVYGIPKGEVSYYGIQCKGKASHGLGISLERPPISGLGDGLHIQLSARQDLLASLGLGGK